MGRFHGMQGRGAEFACRGSGAHDEAGEETAALCGRCGLTRLIYDGAARWLRCQFEREAAADSGGRDPGANIEWAPCEAVLAVG